VLCCALVEQNNDLKEPMKTYLGKLAVHRLHVRCNIDVVFVLLLGFDYNQIGKRQLEDGDSMTLRLEIVISS
jgi:hypothetical protein